MIHRKYHVRFIVLALALSSALVSAIPVRFLAWDDGVSSRKIGVAWGKQSVEIAYMHPSQRTDKIDVPAGAESLRIVAMDKKDEEGEFPFVPLKLGAGMKNALVLLMPDKNSSSGLRLIALEDDVSKFRWGTIHLINATGQELYFIHEKKPTKLGVNWAPVVVAPGGASRNIGVAVFLPDKRDRPIYSAVWQHREELRQLVFMVPNEDQSRGPVDFKFITENRLAIEAKQAETQKAREGE
ncbi:MAG: hypothetical protein ACSHX9_03730 [Luteolibacter sp.]